MRNLWGIAAVTLLVLSIASHGSADVTAEQAASLNSELTPLGAIRAGNDEGTIPPWEGGIEAPPANYSPGSHHVDPFPNDEPLFTITADNVDATRSFFLPVSWPCFDVTQRHSACLCTPQGDLRPFHPESMKRRSQTRRPLYFRRTVTGY